MIKLMKSKIKAYINYALGVLVIAITLFIIFISNTPN